MSVRNLLLILTLFFGVALLGFGYLRYGRTPPPPVAAAPVKMVVIATAALNAGALIAPQGLAFAPEPPGTPAGADFERAEAGPGGDQNAADAATIGKIVGAVARRHIDAGAPVPSEAIVKPGDSGFLAAVLQPGMQAITIGVTAVSGAGGLIYPGDRVDVILTQTFPQTGTANSTHRFGAEPVVQDVRVIAIDQQLQTSASQSGGKLAQTVTVEVTPKQAESVVLATKLGELSLSIRSLLQPSNTQQAPATGPIWAEDISPALKAVEQVQYEQANTTKPLPVLILRGAAGAAPAMPSEDSAAGASGPNPSEDPGSGEGSDAGGSPPHRPAQ